MNIIKKASNYMFNSDYRFLVNAKHGLLNNMSDEEYIKRKFRISVGYDLDLNNPKTFNEKLQWLKLHNRNPAFTKMVDKYEVKQYVASIIGQEHIIPTLGVWNRFEDICFDTLPNQFVLKCTHDSGGIVICKDKQKFNEKAAKRIIKKSLKRNYFWSGREWPYKNVEPRIIAEKYMTDESGIELKDYKVFNFEGEPYVIQIDCNRFINHMRIMYDLDWNKLPFEYIYPSDEKKQDAINKPESLDKMICLARKLSRKLHFVRTDFYLIDDKIYFGELTFFPEAGFGKFTPDKWDYEFGKLIKLTGGGT